LSVQPDLSGGNDLRFGKNGDLSIVFSVQGTGGNPGPDPESRVGDQHIGSPGRPVSFGLQVSGEPRRGIVVQEQDSLGELPAAFFLQNVFQLHQQR